MDRRNGGGPLSPGMSRAEVFEDEKKRIIESCFNRRDPDGSLQETYITHIRITEYSAYTSTPPPPEARSPEIEKHRVVILAVRKSGRVRMHKSKENATGTFSIGKTWDLDHLTQILSYSSPSLDLNLRQWAGDTGFAVTIQKTYFWNAPTDKEKRFFIASLIKIYSKYTDGRTPELLGFAPQELDLVLGPGKRAPPPRPPPDMNQRNPSVSSSMMSNAPPGMAASMASPTTMRNVYPPSAGSPAGSFDSTRSQNPDALRRLASNNRSQDSVAASFTTARSEETPSIPPRSRGGPPPGPIPSSLGRPYDNSPDPSFSSFPPEAQPVPDSRPPQRRRPPMDPTRPQGMTDNDLVPAPLMSPGIKREPVVPPPRSAGRMTRENSARGTSIDKRSESGSLRERLGTPIESVRSESTTSFQGQNSLPKSSSPVPASENGDAPIEPEDARPGSGPIAQSRATREDPTPPMTPVTPVTPEDPADSRPGLGPMIKSKRSKGEIAGSLWRAANAASAFKPRPGGAGERLRLQKKSLEGPDGITGVVPAPPRAVPTIDPPKSDPEGEIPEPVPPLPTTVQQNAVLPTRAESPLLPPEPQTKEPTRNRDSLVPEVKVTVPQSSRPNSMQGPLKDPLRDSRNNVDGPIPEDDSRTITTVSHDVKYLQTLGVDPGILDNNPMSKEFTKWLDFLGFVPGEEIRTCSWDKMQLDVEREIDKAQAGGWLSRIKEEDERIIAIRKGIDVVLNECEELENLLTLYSVELGTVNEDIEYIEAQSQGLQVQAANQKALKKELELILETCSTDSDWQLESLRVASFNRPSDFAKVEESLFVLFKAMSKIDPGVIGGYKTGKVNSETPNGDFLAKLAAADTDGITDLDLDGDQSNSLNSYYGKMRVVQEKRELYNRESSSFIRRFLQQLSMEFDTAFSNTQKVLERALSRKSDREIYQVHRIYLWKYCGILLYARDVHHETWNEAMETYPRIGSVLFKSSIESIVSSWKSNARRLTGDELEILFTSQPEKQHDGIATAARKLTVKRSQTLARSFRSDASKQAANNRSLDSRSLPFEVFRGLLDDLMPLVEMEQNFIVDFFHASTLDESNFADFLTANPPGQSRSPPEGGWLGYRRMEPDRELAKRVNKAMVTMFSFLEQDLQRVIEWVLASSPLQGVGVLAALEQKITAVTGGNQEFINNILQRLHGILESRYRRFVDEQVRAIEETKVKMVKKRQGIVHFFRTFPQFSTAVESILAGFYPEAPGVRQLVNRDYDRIIKAMFDSLKVIARENKGVGVSANSTDPEDKEALNYHILLIENLGYLLEEMGEPENDVLEDRRQEAYTIYYKHLEQYLGQVMRRPLGKLLEYLENVEAQLQALKAPEKIAAQPSNSKSVFVKTLNQYDGKEIRKGIEALRKRVEKHFGGEGDEIGSGSRELVEKVTDECEKFYNKVELRIASITAEVYGGDVAYDWPRAEVKSAFGGR